tara:strand:+ start:1453 stop:1632 length:180 start_codon:yes stop_codon:yes gene_type:complete
MNESLVPLYLVVLVLSVAMVAYKVGERNCVTRVEYRYLPRSQEELEKETTPSQVLELMS